MKKMNTTLLFIAQKLFLLIPETRGFAFKRFLLRLAGASVGKNVRICSSARIIGNSMLSIGDNTWIGFDNLILAFAPITIGNDVNIAPRCYIGTGTHRIDKEGPSIAGKGENYPIVIEDGVWICANVVLLPGAHIGAKSIVAPGAVVKTFVGSLELVGGVPAKTIKNI